MAYCRVALGRGEAGQETDSLAALAATQFADLRPTLDWAVTSPTLPGTAARAALHLVIILGEALASGGEARLSADSPQGWTVIRAEGSGPRVRLHEETRAGLLGAPCPEGPGGRWAFAAFLRSQVESAGGKIDLEASEERLWIALSLPS